MAEGGSIPAKLQRMLKDHAYDEALEFLTGHASEIKDDSARW